jgi:hypothetical protein
MRASQQRADAPFDADVRTAGIYVDVDFTAAHLVRWSYRAGCARGEPLSLTSFRNAVYLAWVHAAALGHHAAEPASGIGSAAISASHGAGRVGRFAAEESFEESADTAGIIASRKRNSRTAGPGNRATSHYDVKRIANLPGRVAVAVDAKRPANRPKTAMYGGLDAILDHAFAEALEHLAEACFLPGEQLGETFLFWNIRAGARVK